MRAFSAHDALASDDTNFPKYPQSSHSETLTILLPKDGKQRAGSRGKLALCLKCLTSLYSKLNTPGFNVANAPDSGL